MLGWDSRSSKLLLWTNGNGHLLMISKSYSFSEFTLSLLILFPEYPAQNPQRSLLSRGPSGISGPGTWKAVRGYYLSIVIIRSQTAQAGSSLKGILISVISRWLLKGL